MIYYISTPGNFLSYTGSTKKVVNYIFLNPYLDEKTTKFNHVLSAGKYLVLLGLLTKAAEIILLLALVRLIRRVKQ